MENQITDSIYWVGVHFAAPAPGGSLNAFLIKDNKTAIIDTGAPATAGAVVANIKTLVDPKEIDYVILTHTDLDHGGGLAAILEAAPQATVVASELEAGGFGMWGVQPANIQAVRDGEVLSLGHHRLRFVGAPFTCTPGTMMVFEESDGVLFSADLFASSGPAEWRVFTDGDKTETLKMLQKMKLGNTRYTKEALARVEELPVKIIASGHGAMIRDNIKEYVDALLAETTIV
ncbi:MAG: FprA family A-type flavoprotein [Actinomycetota bacterium]|nr:FprA family A-type flavoprotein [Actinomycetota bacterium]